MQISHLRSSVSSEEPESESIPLISQEGLDFLTGKITAEEYISDGRRRAQTQAREEIAAATSQRPLALAVPIKWLWISLSLGYFAVAIFSFARSDTQFGLVSLITAAGSVAGSLVARSRSRKSGKF